MNTRNALVSLGVAGLTLLGAQHESKATAPPQLVPGVDYTLPNFAYTQPLTKFVDSLPGLGAGAANNLGQYIPVAVADTTTYPGSAYYEIAVVDYTQQMHSELPATKLRGYVQIYPPGTTPGAGAVALNYPDGTPITYNGAQVYGYDVPRYLGPMILANQGTPTRIKFYNLLPAGAAGDLFVPTDVTIMGAGMGPDGKTMYSQNRATLHLHGGDNPWISDGTPHQWITPAGETSSLTNGVSQQNVPDMPPPGKGAATFYWPNGLSGRLMFYHDHAYGTTRLDVYAGSAAGYLVMDPTERALNSFAPGGEIPLIIQDKTFVWGAPSNAVTLTPATGTFAVDPLWASNPAWGQSPGSLWFPHVYMPNQNPNDLSGANMMGRWDYGPWFWPVFPATMALPQTSLVPESFLDTPVVNGTAYPYLNVSPTTYRLRVLNACNDRYINLQFYVASPIISGITVTAAGSGYTSPVVTISDPTGRGATALASIDPATGGITGITLQTVGSGYTSPTVTITDPTGTGAAVSATLYTNLTEVGMVPASKTAGISFPSWWQANDTPGMTPNVLDGRQGGVPDPSTMGPSFIHIGSEGGLSPLAVELKNTPIGYEQNKRSVTVLNTFEHTLFLGPAERADVLVDFSAFAGKTLIVYNDAPAPVPAGDPRYDLYTADPDNTMQGGAASTQAGYGPNTRTIMQINVGAGTGTPLNVSALNTAVASAFASTQPAPIVPESTYSPTFPAPASDTYARISDTSLTYTPYNATAPITMSLQPKTIQELFDPAGRMNSTLGVELPFTTATVQTTIPYGFIDPVTEVFPDGTTQLWKITHNGVDTHAIHFHLFNVQVINRVGWDGAIKPPWPEELGWKETVKMNPLEDIVVALQAKTPTVPFVQPNNIRPLDAAMPLGSTMGFLGVGPDGNPHPVTNVLANFGAEYTWHCHLLGHEEDDMMRPMAVALIPGAPASFTAAVTGTGKNKAIVLKWVYPTNATSLVLQRATDPGFTQNVVTTPLKLVSTYTDTIGNTSTIFYYRVYALNTVGSSTPGYPNATATGSASVLAANLPPPPAAPSALTASILSSTQIRIAWTDNANNESGFEVWRSVNGGASALLTTLAANSVNYTDAGVAAGNTYAYQVRATNITGASAFAGPASINFSAPAAPSGLTASAVRQGGGDNVTLRWTDNSNNETSFIVQRATDSLFTSGLNTATVGANTTTLTQNGVARGASYYYRVQATNALGASIWVNATPFPLVTP